MSYTAQQLIREHATRMGELYLATADNSASSSTTALIATNLLQILPVDNINYNAWVYAASDADLSNRGLERRATNWSASNKRLTIQQPGFAVSPTTGTYEIHKRTPRERKLEAVNSAVRQLYLAWYREFVDTSITTVANTWSYALSAAVPWSQFSRIEIQINTDATLTGYPYASAMPWNPDVRRSTDAAGNETFTLQFGIQPPPGRIVRLFAEVGYPDLVADTDVLAISGKWGGAAYEWIMKWAKYELLSEEAQRQPAGQTDRYFSQAEQTLKDSLDFLLRTAPVHENSRIIVPGRGTADWPASGRSNPAYLSAFKSAGIS